MRRLDSGEQAVIAKTTAFVKKEMASLEPGHDLVHAQRVMQLALKIAEKEGGDPFLIELMALLHDVGDWKFTGRENASKKTAERWLKQCGCNGNTIAAVCQAISTITFKGAGVKTKPETLEGRIVQDADRLDAMGAVGIARAFSYGGFKNRVMYDENEKPVLHKNFEQYKTRQGTTINHFYEKMLLLKGRMNTKTGRRAAEKRHEFMEEFLGKFKEEWNAKDV